MINTEEKINIPNMILSLSEENKKCAIAAAEALLYTQNNDVLRLSDNELVKKINEDGMGMEV